MTAKRLSKAEARASLATHKRAAALIGHQATIEACQSLKASSDKHRAEQHDHEAEVERLTTEVYGDAATQARAKLEQERTKLMSAALEESNMPISEEIQALCMSQAEREEHGPHMGYLFELGRVGRHGTGGKQNLHRAAALLYDSGKAEALEQLAKYDSHIRALVAFEIEHAGRPFFGSMDLAQVSPRSGPTLPPPPLEKVP